MPINEDYLRGMRIEWTDDGSYATQMASAGYSTTLSMPDGELARYDPTTGSWTRVSPSEATAAEQAAALAQKRMMQSQLTQFRAAEKERVEQFIKTGSGGLRISTDNDGVLYAEGYNIASTKILFKLDGEAITALKSRTRHLKALLTKLAQREGLELRLVDEAIPVPLQQRKVIFWAFKNPEDADDTELVMVNKPARERRSSVSEIDEEIWDDEEDEDEEYDDLPF